MRLISLLTHLPALLLVSFTSVRGTAHQARPSRSLCGRAAAREDLRCVRARHKPAPAYDHLKPRRFEFVPLWGCMVALLYCMRRVDCRSCGVRVEAVPWGIGKHQLTFKAYMLFLAHWARKLSWQETAVSFRTTWDKVCQSVEYVVQWGIEHRQLGPIAAIGVDEIQYAKGHKYLTLVYQIEQQCTRPLWIGRERTVASFEQFFTPIGEELAGRIEFVCLDMWQPYLTVIRERDAAKPSTFSIASTLSPR